MSCYNLAKLHFSISFERPDCWLGPILSTGQRLRQEDQEFKVRLCYIALGVVLWKDKEENEILVNCGLDGVGGNDRDPHYFS